MRTGCASSSGLSRRCWGLGDAAVCCAPANLCAEAMQWISATATATLMLATGTTVHKSFLVPLFALQAPSSAVLWIKGDYGQWIAFLGLLTRLFNFIPGELELLLSTMLFVTVAPYQFLDLRGAQDGAILSAAIGAYLAFQHFTGVGGFRKAFRREAIIATLCIICMTVITLMLVF